MLQYRIFQKILKVNRCNFDKLKCFNNIMCRYIQTRNIQPVNLAYASYDERNTNIGAPPLIIMHGLFGSKQNWRSLSKAINAKTVPQRRIIAVDARNHGESPHSPFHSYEHLAEDIVELLRTLHIEKCSVLGHSMGGRAMMYLTLKYPNLVERAIYVDISPVASPRNLLEMEGIFHAMKTINVPPHLKMKDGRENVKNHLKAFIKDQATIDFVLLNLKQDSSGNFFWGPNVAALHENFGKIAHFPNTPESSSYRGPVLFIGGSKSDYIKTDDMPKIKIMFPNANLVWIDAGHLVHVEKPADFLNYVLNFLNEANQYV